MQQHLLIFTRFPLPGKTKTRLIPALGAVGAAKLQRQLTEHLVDVVQRLQRLNPAIAVTLMFTGGSEGQMRQWLGTELAYAQQHPGDLGERLQTACESAFKAGSEQVVMVGIDCPFITEALLHNTFNALSHYDVVIGPAWDGGYYLLGLNRPTPLYFHNIDWGTDQVYRQTLAKVHLNGDRHFSLPPLPDIDRPPDLAHLSPQFSHWL